MNSLKENPWFSSLLFAASLLILTAAQCGGPERNQVSDCSKAPAKNCRAYEDATGSRCALDPETNTCRVKPGKAPEGECAKKTDANDCKDSGKCTWNSKASPAVCVDAPGSILDTCMAFERMESCDGKRDAKNQLCEWNAANVPPICMVKPQLNQSTIYKWEELTPPGTAGSNEITDLVVTNDNAHLYAVNSKGGERGLYHSNDKGVTWNLVDGDANNGSLQASPKDKAAAVALDTRVNYAALEIKPLGADSIVVRSANKIAVVTGDTSIWGLDTALHHTGAALNDPIPTVSNNPLLFVEVVGDKILFAQQSEAGLLKVCVGADKYLPHTITIVHQGNGQRVLDKVWGGAGLAQNGNLLLWSATQNQTGVYEVNGANADDGFIAAVNAAVTAGIAGAAGPYNAKLVADLPQIFPENSGGDAAWVQNGPKANINVAMIGSFQNTAGNQQYFAGMKTSRGGLASHNGPQLNSHAKLALGFEVHMKGLSNYGGLTRLVTLNYGVVGVDNNGNWELGNSIYFGPYQRNKYEMMTDGSAIILSNTDDARLRAVYGDDDLSYFFVYGKGIFSRTKTQGQPRP